MKTAIALGALVLVVGPAFAQDKPSDKFREWSAESSGIGRDRICKLNAERVACPKPKMDEVAEIYEDPATGEQFWVANDGSWAVPRKTIVHEPFGKLRWQDPKDFDPSLLCPQFGGTATNCLDKNGKLIVPKP